MLVVNRHAFLLNLFGKIKSNIAVVEKIIRKPLLDDMLLVSGADDEIIEAVVRVLLHDVPENRLAADFDHGLRLELGLFGNSCASATCQQNYFHAVILHLLLDSDLCGNHHS